jgi:hypothetical protein
MRRKTDKMLSIYLGDDLNEKWLAFCTANGTTSSESMRGVVRKLTTRMLEPRVFGALHGQPDNRRKGLELHLTESEFVCVQKLAEARGNSPNTWAINLIRANLTQLEIKADRTLEVTIQKDAEAYLLQREGHANILWPGWHLFVENRSVELPPMMKFRLKGKVNETQPAHA